MNTKGIKFLAVLAVMVMAFAAVIVLAPADKDVTAIIVYGEDSEVDDIDPTVVDSEGAYYISDDTTVKIKSMDSSEPLEGEIIFYVQNGKELELNIKGYYDDLVVTIVTVTSDQQRWTTSTVDGVTTSGENKGKIVIDDTVVMFLLGGDDAVNQSVVYTAMMPNLVTSVTTSTSQIITEVWTYDKDYTSDTGKKASQQYATISSDAVLYAEIGRLVTVAPGQSIQTYDETDMETYGVKTIIDADGCITYYAVGMNAGALIIEDDDRVDVQNGSATVSNKNGTSSVKVTTAKGVVFTGVSGNVAVSGTMTAGTMTVSGNVAFASFTDKATVTLNANAVATGTITVGKTLILKNDKDGIKDLVVKGTGTIIAQNEKLWDYSASVDPSLTFSAESDFNGQYDVYAITKVAEVKDAFSTALIKKNQTFRVVADTVVTTALDVEGVLIVEPGVKLTITKTAAVGASVATMGQFAQIINNGEILIQTTAGTESGLHIYGGFLENNGKITASSDADALAAGNATFEVKFVDVGTLKGKGAGFINNGTVTASRNDIVSLDSNFNNKGSVSINGVLESSGLKNAGVFTLNNAKVVSDTGLTVTMTKAGAVFNISSAEIASQKTITVQNSYSYRGTTYNNVFSITAPTFTEGKFTVRGVTVTDWQSLGLELSGNFSVSLPQDAENAVMATEGSIGVYETVNVGKGIDFDFSDTYTYMYVSGTFTAKDAEAEASENLTMNVPGIATVDSTIFGEPNYVAAKYTDGDYTVYTNLNDAVSGAVEAKESVVYVGGNENDHVSILTDIYVPEGMTILGDGTDSYIVIDDGATLAVAADAMVSFKTIIVDCGMIVAEDINNIGIDTVHADVIEADDESYAVACMSLDVALMFATEGTVIELSQDFYAADVDLVIPAGVVVDATAATNGTDFVLVNSNLTVDGVLVVDDFKFIATTDDTIGITVNGYIYDSCPNTSYLTGCFSGWWYTPFGVSYYITDDETDKTWYVLTTIENIQPAINVADDAKVTVTGNAYLDELTVSGRDDMPAEVTFEGNVTIGEIAIDDVTLKFTEDKKISASVKDAIGSITVIGAYAGKNMSIYSLDDKGVFLAGEVTDGADGTYAIKFAGVTGMNGAVKSAINWTSRTETPTILFAGETTVTGKKAYIQFDDEVDSIGMATITGSLVADNNAKIIINSDVQILGALAAKERTEEAVAGTVEVNGNVFVGALKSDIYSEQDAVSAYELDRAYAGWEPTGYGYGKPVMEDPYYTDAAAVLAGNVDVASGYFITVMNGSLVDDAIVEDLEYLDIVIEDTLWITVYGYGTTWYSLDGLKAPIINAKVTTILDANGNPVAKYSHDFKVIYGSEGQQLSAYGEGVLISLDYDVFTIEIKTDGSVKAVYIDGILMRTGQNANIFLLEKVATGTHKVTVEPSAGYTADGCILYTDYGTILPNMTFTFTEYDCDDYMVTYDIKGTQVEPEPVPPTPEEESQWTITTILLVILVVLIAIMAVIVALRLNRS
jgi:hypothetical protein